MTRLKFKTKAQTLRSLQGRLKNSHVVPLVISTAERWGSSADRVIEEIQNTFPPKTRLIVRSSALNEDCDDNSNAGAYLSLADINRDKPKELSDAINQVINSYSDANPGHEFFVQELLKDVEMSGVVMSKEPNSFAPYYVVNYDLSGSTDSVTSGSSGNTKTYIRFRNSPNGVASEQLESVIAATVELEKLFANDAIDVEFAIDRDGRLFILQVRPIAGENRGDKEQQEVLSKYLKRVNQRVKKISSPEYGLAGQRGMFSVMSDWNPAEIIGIRPQRLALSLYKELVTDSIWAYQRDNYGYKNLRSYPLLVSFLGLPYIDVRVSLNSFVPSTLDEDLSEKLVNYYIECLAKDPSNHDKIEFNIIFSCYDLNLSENIKKLLDFGFCDLELDRIKYALLDLTNNIINAKDGYYKKDLAKIEILKSRYQQVIESEMSDVDKIYWLIEDCKRYGTLPFAGLARAGFIAVQILRSFVDLQIITTQEYNLFLNSMNTVASGLARDFSSWKQGGVSRDELMEMYGHLRPGTYDILSPSYREAFDSYFQKSQDSEPVADQTFEFSKDQLGLISKKLVENGIKSSANQLLDFIRVAIEGREYGKFVFTRNLSQVLVLLENIGSSYNITREELAHLDIGLIQQLHSIVSPKPLENLLRSDIEQNRTAYELTKLVKLPQVIQHEDDVYDFHLNAVEPNFITMSRVTEVIVLENYVLEADLSGKIVFIGSADPGYDWIFSRKIGGLVTMYGGINSHMAIRCAELGIPAVIGCGERNFVEWSKSIRLEIDCANKQVRPIS